MKKTVFFDRDGTLIRDCDYLDNVEGVELMPGAGDALKTLHEKGFQLVLISNQSGIARGKFDADMVEKQHAQLLKLLEPYGVKFAAIKFCPHHPDDECECRKPNPGLLLEVAEEVPCDFSKSWMVGDKRCDVQAGKSVGCRTILCSADHVDEADYHAEDLETVARIIKILDR